MGNYDKLDILRAKNAGLTTILIRRNDNQLEVQPDYEINDLRELYKVVEG